MNRRRTRIFSAVIVLLIVLSMVLGMVVQFIGASSISPRNMDIETASGKEYIIWEMET